jgi:hypothetical protein
MDNQKVEVINIDSLNLNAISEEQVHHVYEELSEVDKASTDNLTAAEQETEESNYTSEDNNEIEEDENTEDKPKKKFKFKAKKKNESTELDFEYSINEGVTPTVLDYVKLKSNGRKGQVISHFADDRNSMVVHVDGHTVVCSPSDVEFINPKNDTLPPHMKFDPLTLKGIYESYIGCGLFINNMKITPNDCQVKLSDYFSTLDNEEVSIVIEGENTSALKKYISLTENVNDVIDIANYSSGKMNVMKIEFILPIIISVKFCLIWISIFSNIKPITFWIFHIIIMFTRITVIL